MVEWRPMIDEQFAPARRAGVHTVEVDGEAVLLDEDANRLHRLNHSAALSWRLFDGQTSLGTMADELSEALGIARDRVLADLLAVTQMLVDEGLLAAGTDADHEARQQ